MLHFKNNLFDVVFTFNTCCFGSGLCLSFGLTSRFQRCGHRLELKKIFETIVETVSVWSFIFPELEFWKLFFSCLKILHSPLHFLNCTHLEEWLSLQKTKLFNLFKLWKRVFVFDAIKNIFEFWYDVSWPETLFLY